MREKNLMYSSKPPTASLALFTRKCLATRMPIRAPCLITSFNLAIQFCGWAARLTVYEASASTNQAISTVFLSLWQAVDCLTLLRRTTPSTALPFRTRSALRLTTSLGRHGPSLCQDCLVSSNSKRKCALDSIYSSSFLFLIAIF